MSDLGTQRSPKISKDFSFILSSEKNSEYGKNLRQISHEKKTHLEKSCMTMTAWMDKFYETNELSDVICDESSHASGTEQKIQFLNKTIGSESTNATENISSKIGI